MRMTVGELIERLKQLPPELPVWVHHPHEAYDEATTVTLKETEQWREYTVPRHVRIDC
jgi:hypothetical protein